MPDSTTGALWQIARSFEVANTSRGPGAHLATSFHHPLTSFFPPYTLTHPPQHPRPVCQAALGTRGPRRVEASTVKFLRNSLYVLVLLYPLYSPHEDSSCRLPGYILLEASQGAVAVFLGSIWLLADADKRRLPPQGQRQ